MVVPLSGVVYQHYFYT